MLRDQHCMWLEAQQVEGFNQLGQYPMSQSGRGLGLVLCCWV